MTHSSSGRPRHFPDLSSGLLHRALQELCVCVCVEDSMNTLYISLIQLSAPTSWLGDGVGLWIFRCCTSIIILRGDLELVGCVRGGVNGSITTPHIGQLIRCHAHCYSAARADLTGRLIGQSWLRGAGTRPPVVQGVPVEKYIGVDHIR